MAGTGLSAARGVAMIPAALPRAHPTVGVQRSPGLVVAPEPELLTRGAETTAPVQSSALPQQSSWSEQAKPSRSLLVKPGFLQ